MKNFKNVLIIAALFAIGSVAAKRTGAQPGYTGGTQPVITPGRTPGKQLPSTPSKPSQGIYADIMDQISDSTMSLVDANNRATDAIINKINNANLTIDLKRDLVAIAEEMQNGLTRNCGNNKQKISSLKSRLKELPDRPLRMNDLFSE